MKAGWVSVVIPTFNRAQTIDRAIESVLSQDYPQIEVIVVDDGSSDQTRSRLEVYRDHPRVRCIFKENGGVASARNRGFDESQGEFIALLDSDDMFLPSKISMQIEALRMAPSAGLVWSDMDAIDPAGKIKSQRFLREMYGAYRFFPTPMDLFDTELNGPKGVKIYLGDVFSAIALGNIIHTSTLLFRRSRLDLAGPYDVDQFPARKPGEDHDFHLRLCLQGPVAFLDDVTLHYLVGAGDAITNPQNNLVISQSHVEILTSTLEKYRDRIDLPRSILRTALADAYGWLGQASYQDGHGAAARSALIKSLRIQPMRRERWKYLVASLVPKWVLKALKAMRG